MFGPKASDLIKNLEKLLRKGDLTPTDKIDVGTFVCMTANMGPFGMSYNQMLFDTMNEKDKQLLKGKKKGEKIGHLKIVAIFNVWDEEKKEVPPAEEVDIWS